MYRTPPLGSIATRSLSRERSCCKSYDGRLRQTDGESDAATDAGADGDTDDSADADTDVAADVCDLAPAGTSGATQLELAMQAPWSTSKGLDALSHPP